MNKPLSFIYDNIRYVTLFCEDSFLKTALEPESNVANCMRITGSGGYNAAFKKTFGMQLRNVPVIEDADITRNGNIFIVKGNVVIDDVKYNVSITATGITYTKEDVSEEKLGVSEITNEHEVSEIIEEPKELEETETLEVNESIENSVKEENSEDTQLAGSLTNIGVNSQSVTDTSVVENKKIADEENVVENKQQEVINKSNKDMLRNMEKRFQEIPQGINFVKREKDGIEKLAPRDVMLIGGKSNNTAGVLVNGSLYTKQSKNRLKVKPNKTNEPVATTTYKPVEVKDVIASTKPIPTCDALEVISENTEEKPVIIEKAIDLDLPKYKNIETTEPVTPVKEQLNNMSEILKSRFRKTDEYIKDQQFCENTIPDIESTTTDTKHADCDKEIVLEKLKTHFSEEVRNIIDKIPEAMLGSITEFTMYPIDKDNLDKNGTHYCIDNRWYKSGNWYCIDVVCNASRYFYNSVDNITVEIPIADCKAWAHAIGLGN